MPSRKHDDEFNRHIIEEFRANDGRVGGELAGTTVILVHHRGARTGTVRVVPLISTHLVDGRHVVTASNGGSPTHPAWYHNLRAHPLVTVEHGLRTFNARAEELDQPARAEIWPGLVAAAPSLADFQLRIERQIPVLVLTPLC